MKLSGGSLHSDEAEAVCAPWIRWIRQPPFGLAFLAEPTGMGSGDAPVAGVR